MTEYERIMLWVCAGLSLVVLEYFVELAVRAWRDGRRMDREMAEWRAEQEKAGMPLPHIETRL